MNATGPHDYPADWEKSCLWDGKIAVHFGYPASGWVLLSLLTTAYNGSVVAHLSQVWDPFPGLVDWLTAVAENRLPASTRIDEEGSTKELRVTTYTGEFARYSDVEFRVNHRVGVSGTEPSDSRCVLLCRLSRQQLLAEFYRRLERWLQEDYEPQRWVTGWPNYDEAERNAADLRRLNLAGLRAKIARIAAESP